MFSSWAHGCRLAGWWLAHCPARGAKTKNMLRGEIGAGISTNSSIPLALCGVMAPPIHRIPSSWRKRCVLVHHRLAQIAFVFVLRLVSRMRQAPTDNAMYSVRLPAVSFVHTSRLVLLQVFWIFSWGVRHDHLTKVYECTNLGSLLAWL